MKAAAKTKAGKKQVAEQAKALLNKIRELRGDKNSKNILTKAIKTRDIKTRDEAKKIIKERKAAVQAKVKQIRSDLQTGKTTLDKSV